MDTALQTADMACPEVGKEVLFAGIDVPYLDMDVFVAVTDMSIVEIFMRV